jgi:hypothetical protein
MSTPNKVNGLSVSSLTIPHSPRRTSIAEARAIAVHAALSPGVTNQPVAEYPLNVLTLPMDDRAHLLLGPKINIIGDDNVIIRSNVPIHAFIASSTKLYDLLQIKPKVTQFRVHGKVDQKSLERLLDIFTTKPGLKANEANLVGKDFVKDVLLYQACLSLGIYYAHVKPLLNAIRAEVSARLLTVEEMNTIVNRIPASDPLMKHLANDLCHRRFKKEIPDIVAFEKWLGYDSKKKLQKIMMEIDQEHKRRREAHNMRQKKEV